MAKPKKVNKQKAGAKEAAISTAMTVLVVLIFLAFASMLVNAFLQESDYFKLRAVNIKASFLDPRAASTISDRILSTYKLKNVFNIDLKYIAQTIQKSYGDVRDVVVSVLLPDRLVISLKIRRPVALIKSQRYYPVDEDGVVLPSGSRVDALNDLPVISGVDMKLITSRQTSRNLKLALQLLSEIRTTKPVTNLGVVSINVYDPRNLSFSFKNGVEVRVGDENFRERLDLLSMALRDPRLAMENVKYIDVRFKDIIIGPK